jgi:methylenetetrahydrofolate dehydrogenase (NADP+) / methenyltetrahydrofolate cyclohydrolase
MVASQIIIDGKSIAQTIRTGLTSRAQDLKAKGIQPKLDVILIGEHPASIIYVQNKKKAATEVGIECIVHRLPQDVTQDNVIALIQKLNNETHGILLQLPVPAHLDKFTLLNAIDYRVDVDGLGLMNVGRRTMEMDCLLPCTPKGCMTLIKSIQQDLAGLHAVVVGRSNLVGLPMAQLLLKENCTVTQAHIYTKDLPDLCRNADILVVAIGDAQFIKGDWIKPNAIVIDVGINRIDGKIVGDVDFESAKKYARAITPVPGGVGPMTIASLLENTLEVAEADL